ncbi:MAG: T9SS type A sorting domain-containing protein [Bacteroidetes bacterium]|nr:T9SS type A sorting domain-containing protein [Bacteroidota bacterium]
MKKILVLICLCCYLGFFQSAAQGVLFKAELSSGSIHAHRALLQTKEHEFFYAFVSDSNQLGFALLDSSGNILWNKISRYSENSINMSTTEVVELPFKQFLITINPGHRLLRIDSVGNFMNAYQFSTTVWVHNLQNLSSSRFLIAGSKNIQDFIAIADTSLNIIQSAQLNTFNDTTLGVIKIHKTSSQQIIMFGAASHQPSNFHCSWAMLCDTNLSTIWSRLIILDSSQSNIQSIQEKDGFIYTFSYYSSSMVPLDYILSKIDLATGNIIWVKRIEHNMTELMALVKTESDSLILFGRGGRMIPIDTSGAALQSYFLPILTDYIFDYNSMGPLAMPGWLRSNPYTTCILRTDPSGHAPCFESPDTNLNYILTNEPFRISESGLLIADSIQIAPSTFLPDYFQYSFTTEDGCNYVGLSSVEKEAELSVYPNPADNFINIKLKSEQLNNCSLNIFDQSGRLCFSSLSSTNSTSIAVKNLETGVYLLVIQNADGIVYRKKFVVIHE